MEDLFYAGGLPAVMSQIADLLHLDALTVSTRTVGENIAGAEIINTDVIRPADDPLDAGGSLVALYGSLCPDGAVMKITAADPRLHQHEGRAIVFEDIHDLLVDEQGLRARREAWTPPARKDERGYRKLHVDHVLQANEGCDLDFLRGRSEVVSDAVTYL